MMARRSRSTPRIDSMQTINPVPAEADHRGLRLTTWIYVFVKFELSDMCADFSLARSRIGRIDNESLEDTT